ncbi:MAG: hypothetical protein C4532_14445 [Candidatus Abyssobacteria bacterium SURF_17]|uniref:Uncharacterized protein n=1 Tax=Candidatus Abyssobacteria bacterium SURF_17 TaxID=2093361 RepID=A0A419EU23_9BACT|nr:MAG: hypothetical protein C4532_14445 [Candidatus Abyssubacteria bacterium SURF_17]
MSTKRLYANEFAPAKAQVTLAIVDSFAARRSRKQKRRKTSASSVELAELKMHAEIASLGPVPFARNDGADVSSTGNPATGGVGCSQ